MKQDVTANADAWRNEIASTGRAVVYGILFDTDKATLKPESQAAVKEIAALVGKHGVAAASPKGYGVGPLAPVASNHTEDGRAKNRRVELVAQP